MPYTENEYGAPYLHIHRADYHKILVDEARRRGVDIRLNSHVKDIDFEKPAVVLADGCEFRADVVIGADGLKSVCREALLGHPDPPRLTGDLAYRITVRADEMKRHPDLVSLVKGPAINIVSILRNHYLPFKYDRVF